MGWVSLYKEQGNKDDGHNKCDPEEESIKNHGHCLPFILHFAVFLSIFEMISEVREELFDVGQFRFLLVWQFLHRLSIHIGRKWSWCHPLEQSERRKKDKKLVHYE